MNKSSFISQRNTSFDSRYKFTAKELDNETQYTYFGARYLDSEISIWLSVDPLSDKYPSLSPYAYCANNPVILVDPDGRDIEPTDDAQVNNRIDPTHKDYNKAFHEIYMKLDADPYAVYSFKRMKPINNGNATLYGEVTCSGRNDKGQVLININYSFAQTGLLSKEAVLLEETFHALQFLEGKAGFQLEENGIYIGFAVDLTDEAEAQVFAAQNSVGGGSQMERSLLIAYNKGGLIGAVDFLETRAGKKGYLGMDRGPISAESMFRMYNPDYSSPLYNINGQSVVPTIIMRKP